MLSAAKEVLGDKVAKVCISARLKNHPVCLSTQGGISLEMERVLSAMPGAEAVKAERVLELNAEHEIFKTLCDSFENDRETFDLYLSLLHTQALLLEGILPDDAAAYAADVCKLMTK